MWRLYGLKNCDACRKASAWLKAHQRACEFHDLRDMELTAELLRIIELAKLHGLVIGADLVVTPTSRTAGDVVQTISGDGVNTSTVSRT